MRSYLQACLTVISFFAGVLGCYADSTPSDLSGRKLSYPQMTQSICINFCMARVSANAVILFW